MDNQLQTFMELSAAPELAGLCEDPRAAWVWSADGSRILWANAAGAAFFSVRDVRGFSRLSGLTRSPARPHIARIATSGSTDRMSIDRLRFYRGLRVMLLTCQCRRLTLADGHDAALIVCGDKGVSTTDAPLPAFLALLADTDHSSFVMEEDNVVLRAGALTGHPETLELPEDQRSLSGPLAMQDCLHDGAIAMIDDTRQLVLLENAPLETSADEAEAVDHAFDDEPASTGGAVAAPASLDLRAPESDVTEDLIAISDDAIVEEPSTDQVPDDEDVSQSDDLHGSTEEDTAGVWSRAQDIAEDEDTEPVFRSEGVLVQRAIPNTGDGLTPETSNVSMPPLARAQDEGAQAAGFQFAPRRRPIRFAWKMDIDQRFTFISEEFSETLGPRAADIVGMTWSEISDQFDLDVTGSIARALDRRDTWSGKTIEWPVTGAALRVPVDMAALPAFDRNREFEGYRGFGVCRTADAIDDPLAPLLGTEDDAGLPVPEDDEVVENSVADQDETAEISENDDTPSDAMDATETVLEAGVDAVPSDDDLKIEGPATSLAQETSDALPATASDSSEDLLSEVDAIDASDEIEVALGDETQTEEPAQDLREKSTSPLEGGTLLGASAAAWLDNINVQGKSESSSASEFVEEQEPSETEDQGLSGEGLEEPSEPTEAEKPDDVSSEDATTTDAVLISHESESHTAAATKTTEENDLSGISGTAPLRPREIETAVKTLAKDYGRKSQDELPLNPLSEITPSKDTSVDEQKGDAPSVSLGDNDAGGPEQTEPVDEELDFFDETAAFRDEEQPDNEISATDAGDLTLQEDAGFGAAHISLISGENDNGPKAGTNAPEDDGKVVSITRKPQLVPVDTSRLSKPEKAAFRKIAEALGARLEGDMDGDENDNFDEETQNELAKAIEPPRAGPIDPRLLDRLPIGIAIARDRDVLYANDTLLDLLGYSDLKGLTEAGGLEAVFVEDDDDDALPDAEGMEGTVDGTLKVRLADGGVRPVDARMHSVPWNGGRGLMISFTERTPATSEAPQIAPVLTPAPSSALQDAEDRISELDTILETATDGVLVLDRHGTITKVNRSAEALFGASRSDMEGAPLTDYLAPESHRAAADYLDGLARNGVASILNDGREVLGRVSAGGLIPLFMTIGRVTASGDEPKFCAVLRDITQWKTAEEELTQAKRQAENASSQKSDFLAKISHEIRTPLNAIIGFSEVMMEERFGPIGNERYKEYLKDIRTSGSLIMSLINDLLDLSKIEAGKMELRFSAVSANDVINECVALMQPQANRDRVIIRASLPDSVPSVVADQRSLRQIVLNLLSNAIKFNKSGGQVIVSTSLEDNGEVVLRVRDTGTGMSAKDLSAALEPFRQVHTARHGGGTGLGLPLTKALVEANRAGFQIDSTPEQGTLVEIRFPSQRVLAE
ncbi:PAS domain S-box protein [Roseibium polysiphoniae]|uniref:histidine kinase n=1 Tax=Roseibium polysiphoniae TaxID=2571221 RepID=A0A944GUC1_9HYPH|nr:PAS domain S-box protein [Roseibium polysiphoniae]MBS8261486.1 PAS domain S-box protein [Roseibium polysiphoniae]